MRDSEIKSLTWGQIDSHNKILTVGKSKTDAGTGRTIPLDGTLLDALVDHTRWYTMRFGSRRSRSGSFFLAEGLAEGPARADHFDEDGMGYGSREGGGPLDGGTTTGTP